MDDGQGSNANYPQRFGLNFNRASPIGPSVVFLQPDIRREKKKGEYKNRCQFFSYKIIKGDDTRNINLCLDQIDVRLVEYKWKWRALNRSRDSKN